MGRESRDVNMTADGGVRRRLAAGALTAVMLAAAALLGYVVIVLLVAAVFDPITVSAENRAPLIASIVATALIAVALPPLHAAASRAARRLVKYEPAAFDATLARFAQEMAGGVALEEALPRLAEIVATAVNAARATVWVVTGQSFVFAAAFPAEGMDREHIVPLPIEGPLRLPSAPHVIELRDRGLLLGAIGVELPAERSFSAAESELLAGLAADAALVVHNTELAAQLQARISLTAALAADVRASRARILAASQATRRRVERDIHDSSQQQVLGLVLRLHQLRAAVATGAVAARHELVQLTSATDRAASHLRSLASDVYPTTLRDVGLAGAIAAHIESCPIPVQIEAELSQRYDAQSEVAVYFCCLEAVQNAVKHSAADALVLRLTDDAGELQFEVTDRGAGFVVPAALRPGSGLAGMEDRLRAVGGRLDVTSAPGAGTTIAGAVPAEAARGLVRT